MWWKQEEVLKSLVRSGNTSVKSGNGCGKTFTAACAALWYLYTHSPSVVLTTAPTERQVKEIMWRELRTRKMMANIKLEGRTMKMGLDLSPNHYALGFSTDDIQQMQGFHSEHLLVIIDEANGYPEEMFAPIDGLLVDADDGKLFMIGNPITPIGRFYDSFTDDEYNSVSISCLDHPNVVTGEKQIAGAVTRSWVDKMERLWGKESAFWASRIQGVFPKIATDIVVNLSWAEEAEKLIFKGNKKDPVYLGVDVGEFGGDDSVWFIGTRKGVLHIHVRNNIEPMECAGITKNLMKEYKVQDDHVSVDAIGVGSGVASRLREQGHKINAFKASHSAVEGQKFKDRGTESWWNVRNMLNPNSDIYVPYSFRTRQDKLKAELCTRKYNTLSDGKIQLEDKKRYRSRMKRSPNHADAMAICYSPLLMGRTTGMTILPSVY